jgi:manganese/zinc/iron transport system ATP- binding protein
MMRGGGSFFVSKEDENPNGTDLTRQWLAFRLRPSQTRTPEMTTTARSADWVLKGTDLRLGYGPHVLFDDVSFELVRGEILGIVGPNGSGKSTLLKAMLGLLKPLAGTVSRHTGLRLSYVPQRDQIDSSIPITVLEVVLMGLTARTGALHRVDAADREAALRALDLLGDQALARQLFRNLSRGQQQRVLLARALAGEGDVLVLDEPTAGMDIAAEAAMIEFLRELNQRRRVTIVIVTHLLPIVLNLATSVMLMKDRAILQGPIDDVLREDRLAALYGIPVHLGVIAGRRTLVVGNGDRHV